jgi:putative ABC transport system permease protein
MKSYLKFLSRNKLYTFISVLGLAISLMFVILIGDYAWRQHSVDSMHPDADRIYLMGSKDDFFMWPSAARDIEAMCPEVEQTCCIFSQSGKIKHGNKEFHDEDNSIIMMADSTFFDFFHFPLVQGDTRTALDAPDKCIITESLAQRFFGDRNPIGQEMQLVGERNVFMSNQDPYDSTLVYTVSAVVRELDYTVLPNETQIIISMKRYPQVMGYELLPNVAAYGPTGSCKAFFKMRPGMTLDTKQEEVTNLLKNNYSIWGMYSQKFDFTMTPLRELMFAPQNEGRGLERGDRSRLYILFSAVLAILFFALSNYVNLTVANTGFRAKEMATRRLFGSSRTEISLKLIAESTLMVALSFAIGFGLALCFEKDAISLFGGKIALLKDINPGTVSACLAFILITGIISGIMPSWQLSRYQPIDIVKGNFRFHSKMVLGRIFIILQNVIAVVMLTAGLVIWLQLNHLIHAPLGYNTQNLYYISARTDEVQKVTSQLDAMPFVETVGQYGGTSLVTNSSSMVTITRDGKSTLLYMMQLDSTAWELYDLKVLRQYDNSGEGYYLNEEAMRQFGYDDESRILDLGNGETHPIAGVLEDFHRINVLNPAQAICVRLKQDIKNPYFLVKTNGDPGAKAAFIQMFLDMNASEREMKWRVTSLEESVAQSFEENRNTLRIISLFTLVAIIISIMGFVGMSLFFIRQRKKEIGIRKIMGSSSREVAVLMLRTFCAPLLLSFVIAVPIAWYIMREWLMDFSYRIELSPWIFVVTCLFSLLIAIFSVGIQIIKAIRENPVESVKTE